MSVCCLLLQLTSWNWTRPQISFEGRWISRCWTERAENMHPSHVSDWLTQWMSWALISTTHRPSTDCRVCQHEMAREEQLCIGVDSVSLVYGVERHQWSIVLFCFCNLMHDKLGTELLTESVILFPICSNYQLIVLCADIIHVRGEAAGSGNCPRTRKIGFRIQRFCNRIDQGNTFLNV